MVQLAEGRRPPLFWQVFLFRYGLDSARAVHAAALLLPERALFVEVDLVVAKVARLDELVEPRREVLVDEFDRLKVAARVLDLAGRLHVARARVR